MATIPDEACRWSMTLSGPTLVVDRDRLSDPGIAAWNELALAIVLLPRAARQTFQVGLVAFRGSSRSISARSSRA
jgi:hypothetical protein